MVIVVLVFTSFVNKTKTFGVFMTMVGFLVAAALCNVGYHTIYTTITDGDYTIIYVMRIIFHAFLFSNLLLYVVYFVELLRLEKDKRVPIMVTASVMYLFVIGADIVTTINGKGFRLSRTGEYISANNIFLYGYIAFFLMTVLILVLFRKRLYRRIVYGFYGSLAASFLILGLQGAHGQTSFTVISFIFPLIAMFYLLHSNPYDAIIGSIDADAMEDMVAYCYRHKQKLIFMSLFLPEFEIEHADFPKELQETIRFFSADFFRNAVLFKISPGHIILFAKRSLNPDYKRLVQKILDAFAIEYERFGFDYKIVLGTSVEEISRENKYIDFIRNIQRGMHMNEIHMVEEEDVKIYKQNGYILQELADIAKQHNLDDERVLAFCQPVYNLKTGQYDTAETLMRLKLPEMGMVFPDQFISLAEENGYIHYLTEIILHKTCLEIGKLIEDGYQVKRISVNVSVLEFYDEAFTDQISQIIDDDQIPVDKIAIEVTESQSEEDFLVIKGRMNELRDWGIKFYLDDFGTGYSNMERILELPFDIIKFDRSLVIASDIDDRSQKMVSNLANLFKDLEYKVLYEGIEDDNDEERCKNMSASYLQGYKYSKPIPIERLTEFFSKTS